jgi:hypothetical protein
MESSNREIDIITGALTSISDIIEIYNTSNFPARTMINKTKIIARGRGFNIQTSFDSQTSFANLSISRKLQNW